MLGSGGLTIGQAGEFDYSGSQAIKARLVRLALRVRVVGYVRSGRESPLGRSSQVGSGLGLRWRFEASQSDRALTERS